MQNENPQMIIVMVTVGSQTEGQELASALIQEKLAACINTFPITSMYRWEGAIQTDQEWQLMIKTDSRQFKAIETLVKSRHTYELPEIIATPIVKGYAPYLSWVEQNSSH